MDSRIRGAASATEASGSVAPTESRIRGREKRNGESSSAGAGEAEQVIRWERFLPRRFLRVLLVESDDSTRHIVAALLRKCSYQVAAVADGLKAWEFLKEKHFNFDLVLTEVVMPSLSGIGLLSKIMSNEICKNIPVIMMSSHDSISIVFKCMLKGAADFLVKPVRKNELRNLWQHVWRKYTSSSCGNGSDNQIRFEGVSDNDAASNHPGQSVGNKSKTRDSVERESDTQSSCSKPETETECKRKPSEPLQTENRSFPRGIKSKIQKYDIDPAVNGTTSSNNDGGEEERDKLTGIEIKVTLSIQAAVSTDRTQENSPTVRSSRRDDDEFSLRCKQDANVNPESDSFYQNNESSREFIDFIGMIATGQCSYTVLEDNAHLKDVIHEATKTYDMRKGTCNSSSPLWELSLKRPQASSFDEIGFQERHILNHSDSSAFSRYGNTGRLSSPKSGSSLPNICIRTKQCGDSHFLQSDRDGTGSKTIPFSTKDKLASPIDKEEKTPFAVGPSKLYTNLGHSSTEGIVFPHPQLGVLPMQIPNGALSFQGMNAGYGAILRPVLYPEPSFSLRSSAAFQNAVEVFASDQTGHGGNQHINHVKYSNCHLLDQHRYPHELKEGMKGQKINEESSDPQPMLHGRENTNQSGGYNRDNYNGSGSNRSTEHTNAAVNMGAAIESGNEDGFQNCSGKGLDHDRARREAALMKFRLKRKDRCFGKKVRYYSRKKLAEQRPRLKGQFVRRGVIESATTGTETDD